MIKEAKVTYPLTNIKPINISYIPTHDTNSFVVIDWYGSDITYTPQIVVHESNMVHVVLESATISDSRNMHLKIIVVTFYLQGELPYKFDVYLNDISESLSMEQIPMYRSIILKRKTDVVDAYYVSSVTVNASGSAVIKTSFKGTYGDIFELLQSYGIGINTKA